MLYEGFRDANSVFFEVSRNFADINCDPGYEILFITGNLDNIQFYHIYMIRKNFLCDTSKDVQVMSFRSRLMTSGC